MIWDSWTVLYSNEYPAEFRIMVHHVETNRDIKRDTEWISSQTAYTYSSNPKELNMKFSFDFQQDSPHTECVILVCINIKCAYYTNS